MLSCNFTFQITPYDTDLLLPQVSKALEKRTEIVSRNTYPRLWEMTDRLHAAAHGKTRSKCRTKVISVLYLLTGIFLFIPGIIKPQELPLLLLIGAVAIGAGIWGIWTNRKHRENRFDKSAKLLLEGKQSLSASQSATVFFSEEGMTLPGGNGDTEYIPYSSFECALETLNGFLFIFDTRVAILQKCDLTSGTLIEFHELLTKKIPQYLSIG